MPKIRTVLTGTAAVGLLAAGLALGAPAAYASGPGNCTSGDGATGTGGDACLYYHQGFVGGHFGNPYTINYQGHVFGGCAYNCDGDGDPVRNDAASVYNLDTACTVTLWVYPLGTSGNIGESIGPGVEVGTLNSNLINNEASQTWSGPGAC